MPDLEFNPALHALNFNARVDTHLDRRVRDLLERMHKISDQYNDVMALVSEFNIRANFDSQNAATFLDFEGSEFQEMIDRLHDARVLEGDRRYRFETKDEIGRFKAHLEGKASILKNKNQEPLILIQPLLNLMEQMNKIARTCADHDEKLKEKTNTQR